MHVNEVRIRILEQSEVVLYGAGTVGRNSLAVLRSAGVLVTSFVDAKASTTFAHGLPLRMPDDASFSHEYRRKTTIIVTIFNAFVDMKLIHARLAELGWEKVITFTEFHDAFSYELGDCYWLTSRDYYIPLRGQLDAVRCLWADEKSLKIFDGIVRFRLTGNYEALEKAELDCQYFPDDLPPWHTPLRIVDCGAYDGDTLRQINKLNLSVEAYAGFEPDQANFVKLAREAQTSSSSVSGLVALWPCGTWSHSCQLSFSANHGAGSAVSSQGGNVIQCVALDEVLANFRPTLIKMDIEGAELSALRGAEQMIRNVRPGLAICLYHTPSDLWQIPLLVASWSCDYKFYLRSHCHNGFDLVMYALPE